MTLNNAHYTPGDFATKVATKVAKRKQERFGTGELTEEASAWALMLLGRMVLSEWSSYVKCKRMLDEYHKQNDEYEAYRLAMDDKREDEIEAEERYLAHVWMTDG